MFVFQQPKKHFLTKAVKSTLRHILNSWKGFFNHHLFHHLLSITKTSLTITSKGPDLPSTNNNLNWISSFAVSAILSPAFQMWLWESFVSPTPSPQTATELSLSSSFLFYFSYGLGPRSMSLDLTSVVLFPDAPPACHAGDRGSIPRRGESAWPFIFLRPWAESRKGQKESQLHWPGIEPGPPARPPWIFLLNGP